METKKSTHNFGLLVRESRKVKKLTAERLATMVGVDRTYLSKIEQHNYLPSSEIAHKISTALKMPVIYDCYMLDKHPKAAHFFDALSESKTFSRRILGMIESEKTEDEIIKTFKRIIPEKSTEESIKKFYKELPAAIKKFQAVSEKINSIGTLIGLSPTHELRLVPASPPQLGEIPKYHQIMIPIKKQK